MAGEEEVEKHYLQLAIRKIAGQTSIGGPSFCYSEWQLHLAMTNLYLQRRLHNLAIDDPYLGLDPAHIRFPL